MKKTLTILLCILMLFAAGCGSPADGSTPSESEEEVQIIPYISISMEEAEEMMKTEEDYIILDVRTYEEFDEGHIPNAICIPNETIGSQEITQLKDKNQLIMVYCRSGNRSKEASQKLCELGYANVVEFGGIIDWKGQIEKPSGASG